MINRLRIALNQEEYNALLELSLRELRSADEQVHKIVQDRLRATLVEERIRTRDGKLWDRVLHLLAELYETVYRGGGSVFQQIEEVNAAVERLVLAYDRWLDSAVVNDGEG